MVLNPKLKGKHSIILPLSVISTEMLRIKEESSLNKRTPIEGYVCVLLFAIMTITMFIEVIARYIFNASQPWTGELSRYLFVWFIFISASYAAAEKAHIKVETIHELLPEKVKGIANTVGNCIWLGLTILVTYLGIDYAMSMFGSTSIALKIPLGIIYFGIPIGYGLMSIRIIIQIIKSFQSKEKNAT